MQDIVKVSVSSQFTAHACTHGMYDIPYTYTVGALNMRHSKTLFFPDDGQIEKCSQKFANMMQD